MNWYVFAQFQTDAYLYKQTSFNYGGNKTSNVDLTCRCIMYHYNTNGRGETLSYNELRQIGLISLQ